MNDQVQQPMNDGIGPHHLSYLLRLWRTEGLRGFDWRASLEIPETGNRIGFASLEQLFAFLMDISESSGRAQDTEVNSKEKFHEDSLKAQEARHAGSPADLADDPGIKT